MLSIRVKLKKQLKVSIALVALVFGGYSHAYQVKTDHFIGQQTKINKPVTLILPDSYQQNKQAKFKVIYLLHGHSGDHSNWVKASDVEQLADQYNVLIVMPDGNFNSWYLDSKVKQNSNYESYIAKDLLAYMDQHYRTQANKHGRAITGLSMGGFGALHIAINHQDKFIAAGSMSGGVDVRPFADNWQLNQVLGDTKTHQANWQQVAIKNQLNKLDKSNALAFIIDTGVNDFFVTVNRELHQAMLQAKIDHDYIERPGKHDWHYWRNAVNYQFYFFNQIFKNKQ